MTEDYTKHTNSYNAQPIRGRLGTFKLRAGCNVSKIESAVSSSSIVSFETDGTSAWSKILHKIAHDIHIEGLKVKRITIFEQPLIARIYFKDMIFEPKIQKGILKIFQSKAESNSYDYVVCLELQERPYFKGACSYKIERCLYLTDIKASKKIQLLNRFENITDLLSRNILRSLICAGGRNFGFYQLI